MDPLFLALALDFVADLPPGAEPRSAGLRELVAVHPVEGRDVALLAKVEARGWVALDGADQWFRDNFEEDYFACLLEPERLGARDTFVFEDEKRREMILKRLAAGDVQGAWELMPDRLRLTPTPEATRGETLACRQWAFVDAVLRAAQNRDVELFEQQRALLRQMRGYTDVVVRPMRSALSGALRFADVTLRTGRPPKGAEVAPAAPPITATLLEPVLGVARIAIANASASVVAVRAEPRVAGTAIVYFAALRDGARALSVSVAPGKTAEAFVLAIGVVGAPVLFDIVAQVGLETTRIAVDAPVVVTAGLDVLPMAALQSLAAPAAVGVPAGPAAAAPIAAGPVAAVPRVAPVDPLQAIAESARDAAASITAGPMRDAFVRMVATGTISEAELFAAGGDGFARAFALELARLSREFGIAYDSRTEPQGRIWSWISLVER